MDLPGLPGGPPLQQVPVPEKQTTYLGVGCRVDTHPDGSAALVFVTPTEVVAFPLSPEARERIGRSLLAPSVHVPNGGLG